MLFDPKILSDQELMNKMTDLSAKLNWAARAGGSYPIEQMQAIMNAITLEQRERAFISNWAATQHIRNETLETDPDMKEKREIENLSKPRPRPTRSRNIPIPTRVPVNPDKTIKTLEPKKE